jgi:hypothetical protein
MQIMRSIGEHAGWMTSGDNYAPQLEPEIDLDALGESIQCPRRNRAELAVDVGIEQAERPRVGPEYRAPTLLVWG